MEHHHRNSELEHNKNKNASANCMSRPTHATLRPAGARVKLTAMTAPCDCWLERCGCGARSRTGCIHDTIRSTAADWERAIGSPPASRGSEHAEALASASTRGPAGSGATA